MGTKSKIKKTLPSKKAGIKKGLSKRKHPLRTVRLGAVDALVISNDRGEKLFSQKIVDDSCRAMVENMNEGAVILDENGTIIFTNRAFSILAGREMSSLVGTLFTDFLPSSFNKNYSAFISKCAVRPHRDEFAIAYTQGCILPVSISGTVYEINGNKNVCLIINDLSERKDVEQKLRNAFEEVEKKVVGRTAELQEANNALRVSEASYRNLFNSLIEGYCIIEMVFDADGKPVDYRFLEVNEAFESQTGLHDAQGKLMRDLAPDHEQHWFDIYGRIALTGKAEHFTNEAKALNRWFDVRAFRLGGPESKKVAICFSDITERKKAEQEVQNLLVAVKEEKDRLASVLANINDEVWFADTDKKFTLANPSAIREFRLSSSEIVGVEELAGNLDVRRADGSSRPVNEAPPLRALSGEIIRNEEEIIRTSDTGELRYRQVNSNPVRNSAGEIIGSVSVVRDITESKKAEEEIRRHAEELRVSNEELERFNRAMVGRELRMVELKKQVNELCIKLGEPQRYATDFNEEK